MKDNELPFDRKSHVLYSKPCKKEIWAKIALHYLEAERETVWEKVQRQYVVFLSDWRTDLGELPAVKESVLHGQLRLRQKRHGKVCTDGRSDHHRQPYSVIIFR